MTSFIGVRIKMYRVVFFSMSVSILFLFYNLIGISVLFYLGLAILLTSIFALSEREMFLMISFLIPNLYMFKQVGSEAALLGYFFLIVAIKEITINFNHNIKINIFLLLHIASVLMTCTIYMNRSLLFRLVRFVSNFCLFSYYAILCSRSGEIKMVVKMYFAGTIVAILAGLIFHFAEGDLYNGLFGGVNSERNYFGAVITPAITIALLYFLEKKVSFLEIILYGATMALCIISIVLSHSRTSVLGLLIPIFVCFLYAIRALWRFNKKLLPLLLLLSIIAFFVFNNYQDMILSLLMRFGEDDMKTGSARFVLWQYYITQTLKNPITLLFGSGSTIENQLVEHSTIVECLYRLGVLGLSTILGFIQQTFGKITRGDKLRFISFFPLLSVIFPFMGISAMYSDQLSYLLILCALIMKDLSKTKVANNCNRNIA